MRGRRLRRGENLEPRGLPLSLPSLPSIDDPLGELVVRGVNAGSAPATLVGANPTPKAIDYAVSTVAKSLTAVLIGAEMVALRLKGRTPEGLDRILSLIGDRFLDRLLEAANSMTQPDLDRMWNMSVVTPKVPDLKVLTFAG